MCWHESLRTVSDMWHLRYISMCNVGTHEKPKNTIVYLQYIQMSLFISRHYSINNSDVLTVDCFLPLKNMFLKNQRLTFKSELWPWSYQIFSVPQIKSSRQQTISLSLKSHLRCCVQTFHRHVTSMMSQESTSIMASIRILRDTTIKFTACLRVMKVTDSSTE